MRKRNETARVVGRRGPCLGRQGARAVTFDGGANAVEGVTSGRGSGGDPGSVDGWRAGEKSFAPGAARRVLSGSTYA
jgi:hypothetical protein